MKILEHCSSKVTNTFGEFELEGVCRLQDQPSPSDSEPGTDENTAFETFGLKSRKRVFTYLSPEKEEKHEAKRACTNMFNLDLIGSFQDKSKESKTSADTALPEKPRACSLVTPVRRSCVGDDNVFLLSGSTPPVKSALSASSLLALTQSPLLCQGQTPSWRKRAQVHLANHGFNFFFVFAEEELDAFQDIANQELSPCHSAASRKRPLSRTYSRKKLLS
ncbi:Treslin [Struthio camelus australis]|uniref:Treslin n=1 Tax=Struthio camelus australis TaxID=441894 RepID=A0A093I048_STRCA|nr:Treslin [Struthio camelus australis]